MLRPIVAIARTHYQSGSRRAEPKLVPAGGALDS
jgi:hypothetical protein